MYDGGTVNTDVTMANDGAILLNCCVNQNALRQNGYVTTLREDDSTLSVIRHKMCSLCVHTASLTTHHCVQQLPCLLLVLLLLLVALAFSRKGWRREAVRTDDMTSAPAAGTPHQQVSRLSLARCPGAGSGSGPGPDPRSGGAGGR